MIRRTSCCSLSTSISRSPSRRNSRGAFLAFRPPLPRGRFDVRRRDRVARPAKLADLGGVHRPAQLQRRHVLPALGDAEDEPLAGGDVVDVAVDTVVHGLAFEVEIGAVRDRPDGVSSSHVPKHHQGSANRGLARHRCIAPGIQAWSSWRCGGGAGGLAVSRHLCGGAQGDHAGGWVDAALRAGREQRPLPQPLPHDEATPVLALPRAPLFQRRCDSR